MNALELANILEKCVLDGSTDLVCVYDAVIMLRQLHTENEALKADNLKYKEWSEYTEKKADEFYAEIEALKRPNNVVGVPCDKLAEMQSEIKTLNKQIVELKEVLANKDLALKYICESEGWDD